MEVEEMRPLFEELFWRWTNDRIELSDSKSRTCKNHVPKHCRDIEWTVVKQMTMEDLLEEAMSTSEWRYFKKLKYFS